MGGKKANGETEVEKIAKVNVSSASSKSKHITFSDVEKIFGVYPSPRTNFTLTAHPLKKELILFGGEFFNGRSLEIYNDLLIYDIVKKHWHEIRGPYSPIASAGHQMIATSLNGGQLWLFGGVFANTSQQQNVEEKNLWMLSLTSFKWRKIDADYGPSARSGHRMVLFRNKLIIFGGFIEMASAFIYYNDVHVFSLESEKWQTVIMDSIIAPEPRSDFGMTVVNDSQILIWGGYSKSAFQKDDNDVGKMYTNIYSLIFEEHSSGYLKYKWIDVRSAVCKSLDRYGVSYANRNGGTVYCFGGVNDKILNNTTKIFRQFSNALLSFNPSTLKWKAVKPMQIIINDNGDDNDCNADNNHNDDGNSDDDNIDEEIELDGSPVAKRQKIASNDNAEYPNGMVHLQQHNNLPWMNPKVSLSSSPSSSTSNSSSSITTSAISSLSLTSTSPSLSPSSSSSSASPSSSSSSSLSSTSHSPAPRMNAGMCICSDILYIFGGVYEKDDIQYTLNDFYALDLNNRCPWSIISSGKLNEHEPSDNDGENSSSD